PSAKIASSMIWARSSHSSWSAGPAPVAPAFTATALMLAIEGFAARRRSTRATIRFAGAACAPVTDLGAGLAASATPGTVAARARTAASEVSDDLSMRRRYGRTAPASVGYPTGRIRPGRCYAAPRSRALIAHD